MSKCQAVACYREAFCKGFCGKHYKRFAKGQDVNADLKGQQSLARGELKQLGLHKHHPFYLAWTNMKTRCDNPKSTQYKWYGQRGIHYCKDWKKFRNFYMDMFPTWERGLILDREDNDGDYHKGNCRWVTYTESAWNRSSTLLLTEEG